MAFKARTMGVGAYFVGHPLVITAVNTNRNNDSWVEGYLIAEAQGRPLDVRQELVHIEGATKALMVAENLGGLDLDALELGAGQALLADHLADVDQRRLRAAEHFGLLDLAAEPVDSLASQLINRHVRMDLTDSLVAIQSSTKDEQLRLLVARILGTRLPR